MDSEPATETVDSGSIPGQVKSTNVKTGIVNYFGLRSAIKSANPIPCAASVWAGAGSLTRRPKGHFALLENATYATLTLWRLHRESFRSAVLAQSPESFREVSNRRRFPILCNFTETPRRLR